MTIDGEGLLIAESLRPMITLLDKETGVGIWRSAAPGTPINGIPLVTSDGRTLVSGGGALREFHPATGAFLSRSLDPFGGQEAVLLGETVLAVHYYGVWGMSARR